MMKWSVGKSLLTAGAVTAVALPAVAVGAGEGQPVDGGARNPSNNAQQAYTRETEIIATTDTYGTRQSNKSNNGGGAVYGCRSGEGGTPRRNEPCLRGTNLVRGLAFEFESRGPLAGTITAAGGDNARPFTTNATGVATGLNADRVDGREAASFLSADAKAVDAERLDGRDSADFVARGDLLSARVTAAGNVASGRGAVGATVVPATNTFTVEFNRDVSECAVTATLNGVVADPDVTIVASATAARTVTVDESNDGAEAVPFSVQVTC